MTRSTVGSFPAQAQRIPVDREARLDAFFGLEQRSVRVILA
jgi:hypothetical protein